MPFHVSKNPVIWPLNILPTVSMRAKDKERLIENVGDYFLERAACDD
jgi:hypothetical protein